MLRNIIIVSVAAIVVGGLFGCPQQSALNDNWGRSFESARYNQILDPDAGKNQDPVEGINGPAAERAVNDYFSGKASKNDVPSGFGVGSVKK